MNHALTFVLQMEWVSDKQCNQNLSKYRFFCYQYNKIINLILIIIKSLKSYMKRKVEKTYVYTIIVNIMMII